MSAIIITSNNEITRQVDNKDGGKTKPEKCNKVINIRLARDLETAK